MSDWNVHLFIWTCTLKPENSIQYHQCYFFIRTSQMSPFGHIPLTLKSPPSNTDHHTYFVIIFPIFYCHLELQLPVVGNTSSPCLPFLIIFFSNVCHMRLHFNTWFCSSCGWEICSDCYLRILDLEDSLSCQSRGGLHKSRVCFFPIMFITKEELTNTLFTMKGVLIGTTSDLAILLPHLVDLKLLSLTWFSCSPSGSISSLLLPTPWNPSSSLLAYSPKVFNH